MKVTITKIEKDTVSISTVDDQTFTLPLSSIAGEPSIGETYHLVLSKEKNSPKDILNEILGSNE